MKIKLRWKWNLSKSFSPKIYSYTVYSLTRVKKDKDFKFLAIWAPDKIILPTSFILSKIPPTSFIPWEPIIFHLKIFQLLLLLFQSLLLFWTWEQFVFLGGVQSSFRFDSRTTAFKRSDWKSLNPKLFADETSLFTIISDPKKAAAKQLSADLDEIKEWAFQWKMSFNLDLSKQA